MKERPILFQGAMVRALLAGTKTQTRRVVKWRGLEPGLNLQFSGLSVERSGSNFVLTSPTRTSHAYRSVPQPCPYGLHGDRLWVREAWGYFDPDGSGEDYDRDHNDEGKAGPCTAYRKEMLEEGNALRDYWRRRIAYKATFAEQKYGMGPVGPKRWRPSIHMPRWASRITLEITAVRVERLRAISEADCIAEGAAGGHGAIDGYGYSATPQEHFRDIWLAINGPASWQANPWVWVVSFRRVQP